MPVPPDSVDSGASGEFDLSADSTPPEWLKAEHESPQGDDHRPLKRKRAHLMPKGKRASVFSTSISALVASLIGGLAWYWSEVLDFYQDPWIAIVVGILIAVLVRIGSGGYESAYLAAFSLTAYLVTALAVLLLITRHDLGSVYGTVDGFAAYEDHLVRTRLQNPRHLLAYGLGALASVQVTFLLRRR